MPQDVSSIAGASSSILTSAKIDLSAYATDLGVILANWQLPFPEKMMGDPFGVWPAARKKMGLGPHRGADFNGMKKGAPLKAVADGVISQNYWSDILGWVVELKVKSTFKGKPANIYFMYCHLDKQSPLKVKTKVTSGQSVGGAGTTGSASSGIHLHFAMSTTTKGGAIGKVYDPVAYIKRRIKDQEENTNEEN